MAPNADRARALFLFHKATWNVIALPVRDLHRPGLVRLCPFKFRRRDFLTNALHLFLADLLCFQGGELELLVLH